jgi:outer membrane immunogenic protein
MQTKPLNRLIFTAGAAFVATFLAFAATTVRAGLFSVPSEPADWNGMFVAFNAGGVWSNFDWSHDPTTVDLTRQYNLATGTVNSSGNFIPNDATAVNLISFFPNSHSSDDGAFIGGVDLGYNKQFGHFVIGGVFGFSGTKVTDQSDFRDTASGVIFVNPTQTPAGDVNFFTDYRSMRKIEQEWSGYVGAQAGFAFNRLFFYATGGAAFAQIDVHSLDRANTDFTTFDDEDTVGGSVPPPSQRRLLQNNTVQCGWYVGGGTQFAFTDAVSAGIEFRHSDYGDTEYHLNVGEKGHATVFPAATTVSYDNNSVLFKVTILLGHLGEKHAAPAPGMTKK